jgi:hypothetical protein
LGEESAASEPAKLVGRRDVNVDDRHFSRVAKALVGGDVVPFLGAGANLCDRPGEAPWEPGRFAPSGRELARALAESSDYPNLDDPDLLWVSQYFDAVLGGAPLYEKLRDVFDADYTLSSLHRLLARVPALMRASGAQEQLLVLTTNYDDLVERALEEAGEAFDVVWYEAKPGPQQGFFWHRPPTGEPVPIKVGNKYTGLALNERPVILKLHGAVDRGDKKRDSYVLTEDSYIDYLAGPSVSKQIPASLMAKMSESHFLFLGYSMRDWNMRVILKQLWGSKQLGTKSWSVQLEQPEEAAREVEKQLWSRRGDVDLLYAPLKEYVERLDRALTPVPAAMTPP